MFRLTDDLWTERRPGLAKPGRGSRFTDSNIIRPATDGRGPAPEETPFQTRRRRRARRINAYA